MADLYSIPAPQPSGLTVSLTPEQANHLLRLQRDVLAEIVQNDYAQQALELLCRSAEALLPNAVASVMLYDERRESLQVRAAPSIPQEAIEALNGLVPGERAGSCGTAVFKGEPQFVCDTRVDPRWSGEDFRRFAEEFNLRACWSMPIRIGSEVVGSMALSSFEKRKPSEFHRLLLETAAYLAGIVLRREREQRRLWRQAHYDSVTGLPNRRLFERNLQAAVQRARHRNEQVALLFIDLDHFKDINETLGHRAGDAVLRQVADSLRALVEDESAIARLGGDEFVLLLTAVTDPLQVHHFASWVLEAVKLPVTVQGHQYRLSASIGISLFPEDGEDFTTLHKQADLALYEAKAQGRGRYIHYRRELAARIEARTALVEDIHRALAEDQFQLTYQPLFTPAGHVAGFEALIRWQHPHKGWIPPLDFIPLAEETGWIGEIGDWVLETACRQCLDWWRQGAAPFRLALNVSVKQLQSGYAAALLSRLRRWGFPPERLELEVTESLLMDGDSQALEELALLREERITVAMDDFGTGHSSLAQLKRMPIDRLKIDRSFVRDIPADRNDEIIVRTIVAMGHALGLEVVAEGVETEVQRDFLVREGCDLLQGYFFSRPLAPEAAAVLLR
ncbi:hypothetical protein MIN45_P2007 [Methylomarinovum tepidoasis]|uniref:Uncharacterized protein n=1 Tax=Methylomarinovum tepidoasis TaxID=2840183 RepID=A0AAU9D3S8_9GAMM|nr:EAL domain-containing protein [Methylomarinovum sp. IN45]BCX89634.1 hypothetical protein MIN45_P2007 [Methylomarinovum sp. IN45]